MTTTRALGPEGLAEKTRVLDAQQTRGAEVTAMRERWASLQNDALERLGVEARVDHRSLAAQREAALARGDERAAEALDRPAEVKLGPTVSAIERREARAAEREGRAYVPLTERGAQVREARRARGLLEELARVREEMRERAALARETYAHAREEGVDHVRAGLAALRAAAQRQGIGHERAASADEIRERLGRLLGREAPHRAQEGPGAGPPAHEEDRRDRTRSHGAEAIRERLAGILGQEPLGARREEPAHEPDPIRERLRVVLARERPAAEREGAHHGRGHEHEGRVNGDERDEAAHRHRERGREDDGHSWGL